jgi:hypothetical protein
MSTHSKEVNVIYKNHAALTIIMKNMEETFSDLINYFKKIELKLLDVAT